MCFLEGKGIASESKEVRSEKDSKEVKEGRGGGYSTQSQRKLGGKKDANCVKTGIRFWVKES